MIAVLGTEREKHQRLIAGIGDGAGVDLSLVKLPKDSLMFPTPPVKGAFSLSTPGTGATTKEFVREVTKLGFPGLRLRDLRGSHETCLLDVGVPVHVVAAQCGHHPAVLLRVYAKRTKKAETTAAAAIAALSKAC
jgi:integrase